MSLLCGQIHGEKMIQATNDLEKHTAVISELQKLIEEWDGDIKDAVESCAVRSGIEGVESGCTRWFDDEAEKATASTVEENAQIFYEQCGYSKDFALKLAVGIAMFRSK